MERALVLILFALMILTGCASEDGDGESATKLVWTKTIGGSGEDSGYAIAVDASGHVYITGSFSGTVDFDSGSDSDSKTAAGSTDIFVTRLNSDGSYGWTKTIGGSGEDSGYAIAVDASGHVYITGSFSGTVDFDSGSDSDSKTAAGSTDIFVTRLGSNTGDYGWTKTIGGSGEDSGYAIAVDASGHVYITGSFSGTVDFDSGSDSDSETAAGSTDIFVTRLNSDGSYGWTKTIGGSGEDSGYAIAVDASGHVYITGSFSGTVDFDSGSDSDSETAAGSTDIFVTRLNSDGSYGWTKTIGGSGEDSGYAIAVDASGHVYITGSFSGTVDFDSGSDSDSKTAAGSTDIFVTRLGSNTGDYGWTNIIGGSGEDSGYAIAVDASRNMNMTGRFSNTVDFDPSTDSDSKTAIGGHDGFVTKFSSSFMYSS